MKKRQDTASLPSVVVPRTKQQDERINPFKIKETEKTDMLLTKKELDKISESLRISISLEVEKELLEVYGDYAIDDEGHAHEYTEQDIYEQLRKVLT